MSVSVAEMQTLVQSLFDNPSFLSRLRAFYQVDCFDLVPIKEVKSMRTDISQRLQESQSRSNIDMQLLTAQIQQLLCQLYAKSYGPKNQPVEICGIYQQIQLIREQMQSVTRKCTQQIQQIRLLVNSNQGQNGKFITIGQHANWEHEIMEKLDIIVKRNFHKVESVFADKLNSFQMNMQSKIASVSIIQRQKVSEKVAKPKQKQQQAAKPINNCQQKQHYEKPAQQTSNESELVKKLKASKSLGSLFGFKR